MSPWIDIKREFGNFIRRHAYRLLTFLSRLVTCTSLFSILYRTMMIYQVEGWPYACQIPDTLRRASTIARSVIRGYTSGSCKTVYSMSLAPLPSHPLHKYHAEFLPLLDAKRRLKSNGGSCLDRWRDCGNYVACLGSSISLWMQPLALWFMICDELDQPWKKANKMVSSLQEACWFRGCASIEEPPFPSSLWLSLISSHTHG